MTSRTIIGADPGASGGIAWANRMGVQVVPMPDTRRGIIDVIRGILKEEAAVGCDGAPVAYIEKITGFIPDGGASQMFEFGRTVERIGCILETLGIRIVEVTPQLWQKSLGLGTKGLLKATKEMTADEKKGIKAHNGLLKRQWKAKLKGEAERRFPSCDVTLKTCDALLILDHAISAERGTML